jgi:hypothetical protein
MFEGPGNPELVEELQEKLASFGSQVVLVDRVRLATSWRGDVPHRGFRTTAICDGEHDLGVRAKQVVREAWSGGEAATG